MPASITLSRPAGYGTWSWLLVPCDRMLVRMQRAIRGAFVALVVSCACGGSLSMSPREGDAGADVADAGPDLPRLDLRIEVDCPDCNGYCGDGVLKAGEQCDDGNKTPGDGCSLICQLNPGWICPMPGMPCERTSDQDAARTESATGALHRVTGSDFFFFTVMSGGRP